jgi:hypothetical protein
MKVGVHAQEQLSEIISRKCKEIEDTGYAMWGYGGNTCHPRTMVQPFARDHESRNSPIHLVMQKMNSKHFADPLRANEYSVDGVAWSTIPSAINVLGSRFALVIEDLKEQEMLLPLSGTKVAVGLSRGRIGSRYLRGQVDKACLEIQSDVSETEIPNRLDNTQINLIAKLKEPYAVFLRDHR